MMAKEELSQTNVFHQTAVWAALHKGMEGGSGGMWGWEVRSAEPRGNQSELLHPPFLSQSHWGLRCALHGLIPSKLDCLCESNQSFVNYHFGNESAVIGKQNLRCS